MLESSWRISILDESTPTRVEQVWGGQLSFETVDRTREGFQAVSGVEFARLGTFSMRKELAWMSIRRNARDLLRHWERDCVITMPSPDFWLGQDLSKPWNQRSYVDYEEPPVTGSFYIRGTFDENWFLVASLEEWQPFEALRMTQTLNIDLFKRGIESYLRRLGEYQTNKMSEVSAY